MLYLNDPLLTSERIIAYFENMLNLPEHQHRPSNLRQLKNKLKANFFANLDKTTSDEDVLKALTTDARFTSAYPKLKQVFKTIFSLTDDDDKPNALAQLKAIDCRDENIEAYPFYTLDNQYRYFRFDDSNFESIVELFLNLAIACRTMIVLFEKNNDRDDSMAYDYAYKLMALYLDPANLNTKSFDTIAKETYNMLDKIDTDKAHPFHEALLVKLRLPKADDLTDKAGWREFIKTEGVQSFFCFEMARKIEEKIAETSGSRRAPKNLKEANAMAMLCTYSRAKEDVVFAEVCHQYKVPEYRFNCCLNYLASTWPKKTGDSIPDITIKGEGEAEGFYWLKMPVTDKRALILGDITYCCQSIAGYSEQCVKDAVSLGENGLYVLVKQRKKDGNPALITNGAINDRDFKIIGQAYTWKSKNGNICLDSIECLNDGITNPALKSILSAFGNKLLQENQDIKFVTVGRGGRTPNDLFDPAPIPENIRQGHQYGDSQAQYYIAKTPSALPQAQADALHILHPQPFQDCMDYLSYYSSDWDIECWEKLLRDDPSFSTELTPLSLERLLTLTQSPTIQDLEPVNLDDLDKMEPDDREAALKNISPARLFWRSSDPKYFARAIQYVAENERFDVINKLNMLFCSLDQPECLNVLLNSLPQERFLDAMKQKDDSGRPLLHEATRNLQSMTMILNLYPKHKLLEALNTTDAFGNSILQRVPINKPECFRVILNFYSEDQRLAEVKKKNRHGQSILHPITFVGYADSLSVLLKSLPENHRLDAVEDRDENGRSALEIAAARHLECLAVILNSLPAHNQRNLLRETLFWDRRDFLSQIMSSLTDDRRFALVMIKDEKHGETALHFAATTRGYLSLLTMLNYLPNNKRLEAVMEKDNDGYSVLQVAAEGGGDILIKILETLSEDERFDVVYSDIDLFTSPELFPELKRIVLKKILANDNAVFDEIKQRITNATAFPEVKEHLQALGRLLILYPATKKEDIRSPQDYKSKVGELKSEQEQIKTTGLEK